MAKKTPAQLKTDVQVLDQDVESILPDNVTGEIEASDLRTLINGLTAILTDICDSFSPLP